MRIGIFGGAFDPPHAGHKAVAHAARVELQLDRVAWVPTFSPPHKSGPSASFVDRCAMVRALIGPNSRFEEVSEVEASLTPPSYTLHTLRALKQERRDAPADWFLILGADNALTFSSWHRPDEVLAEASLAVYPREGHRLDKSHAEILPPGTVVLNCPEIPEQSTRLREQLAAPDTRDETLAHLDGPVADIIRARGLYAPAEPSPESAR
jgi:nicotinate-nucleotide adenylyltransferase